MAALNRRRGREAAESGAELIEFALAFPLFLFVAMGIIDFGFLLQRYEVVTNAAREGARVAVLPGYGSADVEIRVDQYLTAGGLTASLATTTVGPAAQLAVGTQCVTVTPVTVAYPHNFSFVGGIASFFGGDFTTATLQATSTMRNEVAAGACP